MRSAFESNAAYAPEPKSRGSATAFAADSKPNSIIRALSLLNEEVNRQAAILTYMDCFRLLMWISLALSPFALFFNVQSNRRGWRGHGSTQHKGSKVVNQKTVTSPAHTEATGVLEARTAIRQGHLRHLS